MSYQSAWLTPVAQLYHTIAVLLVSDNKFPDISEEALSSSFNFLPPLWTPPPNGFSNLTIFIVYKGKQMQCFFFFLQKVGAKYDVF